MIAVLKLVVKIMVRKKAFQKSYFIDEIHMMTDHTRREIVKRYAAVQLDAKGRLLEGKQRIFN